MQRHDIYALAAAALFLSGIAITIVSGIVYAVALSQDKEYESTTCLVMRNKLTSSTCSYEECTCSRYNDNGSCAQEICSTYTYRCYGFTCDVIYPTEDTDNCANPSKATETSGYYETNSASRSKSRAQNNMNSKKVGSNYPCYYSSTKCTKFKWSLLSIKQSRNGMISGAVITGIAIMMVAVPFAAFLCMWSAMTIGALAPTRNCARTAIYTDPPPPSYTGAPRRPPAYVEGVCKLPINPDEIQSKV